MERRDNEFRTSVERLPADHGRDSLPPAGPSGPAAGLHLAGLRPGATLSRTAPLPGLLAKEPGRPAALGEGGEHPHNTAHRNALGGRLTDAALAPIRVGWSSVGRRVGKEGVGTCSSRWSLSP